MLTPAEQFAVIIFLVFIALMIVLLHIWFPLDRD